MNMKPYETTEQKLHTKHHRALVEEAVKGIPVQGMPIPTIDARSLWEQIPEDYRAHLVKAAEELLGKSYPQILLSDYRDFLQTGNREHYESLFFERLRMLDTFVLAEVVENEGRFLDAVMDGLWLILEQTSWCLPAHNSYIRDTKQDPIPRDAEPVIDLFAAETGATIALADRILGPRLDAVSPHFRTYLANELHKRIFVPYLTYHFWWMGDGESQMLNWTPWITGNVLLAAFDRPEGELEKEELDRIRDQAALSLDYFLDEYGEDGCCDEGAQYYSHAGLALYTALHCLDEGLDWMAGTETSPETDGMAIRDPKNRIKALYQQPLIRNIASYITNVYVGHGSYVNFADCSPKAGRRTAGEYAFGRDCERKALTALAVCDFQEETWEEKLMLDQISLYERLRQALYAGEMERVVPPSTVALAPEDVWYESTGLMVARDEQFVLAVKAGNNGDNHNHNDVGSFLLYAYGLPVFIDVGVETYTKKTFSKDRYDIWTMQSRYHNLPTFYRADGSSVQQKAGRAYGASDVHCERMEERAVISMDLAAAYGDPAVRRYTRTVTFEKNGMITLLDEADTDLPFALSLMTCEKPEILVEDEHVPQVIEEGYAKSLFISLGKLTVFAVSETLRPGETIESQKPVSVEIEEIQITDERLRKAWPAQIYRLQIRPNGKTLRLQIC